MLGGLGGPDWNDGVKHSCTPSIDKTGADHPSVVLGRCLKSSTDDGPTRSKSDCLDAAITVTEPTTNETAHESTEIVDGHDATLKKSIVDDWSTCFGIWMTKFHGSVVVVDSTVDTTHHTLIISKEEDGETSDAVDCDEKATLLVSVDHIGPRNEIHGGDYPECLEVLNVSFGLKYEETRCPVWLWRSRVRRKVRKRRSNEGEKSCLGLRLLWGMGDGSYIEIGRM